MENNLLISTKNNFIYCHLFIDNSKGIIKSLKIPINNFTLHFIDLKSLIKNQIENDPEKSQSNLYTILSLSKTIISPSYPDSLKISNFIKHKSDIFCKVELNIVPIKSSIVVANKDDNLLKYNTITNYSFYEASKTIVKVLVPLIGIEKISKEKISSKFTDNSVEVKIQDFNGRNYIFGVPRLHLNINKEKSEVKTIKDNIVIRLRKVKDDDNWSYLYKTKFIGETD
jgi:hypothetical protein